MQLKRKREHLEKKLPYFDSHRNKKQSVSFFIDQQPNKQLEVEICVLPPIMFGSTKGFRRFKTVNIEQVKSVKKILRLIKDNSCSLKKYNTQSQIKQKHHSSFIHSQSSSQTPYIHRRQNTDLLIKNPKRNLSILSSQKASKSLKPMSDLLKICINPKYRQIIRSSKQQKQKQEQKVRNQFGESLQIRIKIQKFNNVAIRPQSREGCQIVINDKKLYVLGGQSRNNKHLIDFIDLKRKEWAKLQIQGYKRRSYHSCIVFNKSIYQFFGFEEAGIMEQRRLAVEIDVISLDKKSTTKFKLPSGIQPRFEQCVCLFSQNFIIIAGGRSVQRYLKDCFLMSLSSEETKPVLDLPFDFGLAGHTMCSTPSGLYLFGGRSGDGQASNRMLYYDDVKNGFFQLKTHGVPPLACFAHSMHYFKRYDLIMIIGGRNDSVNNPFLKQVVAFNYKLDAYFKINDLSGQFQNDGFFCYAGSQCEGSTVFIYGGMNMKGINNSVWTLQFDIKTQMSFIQDQ